MERTELEQKVLSEVRGVIESKKRRAVVDVTLDANLRDLDLCSIDRTEILVKIADELHLTPDQIQKLSPACLKTVLQIVEQIDAALKA